MSQIYAPNQSISYSQGNQSLDIIPATGLVITSGANHLTINSTQLTNGTQTLLFSDIYTTVNKCNAIVYPAVNPTTLTVKDTIIVNDALLTKSTIIGANLATFELVGDTHQTHIDNTQVHILDTVTLDEMFIDHNSLILVQPSTTHQTELLGNMLDFQTPQNVVSCGHETYMNGNAGFEAYDLLTGYSSFLGSGQLDMTGSSGTVSLQSGTFLMQSGTNSIVLAPTVISAQGTSDNQVNHYNTKIDFVESLVVINTLTSSTWSGSSAKINTTSDNTATVCYIPFTKTAAGTGKLLYVDDTTGPLTYNPSTGVLSCTNFTGAVTGTASAATLAANSSNLTLPLTLNLATYTLGTTLTVTGASSTTFRNSNITFTGSSNTVSILALVTTQVNGKYSVGIFNNGSGNLTFQTGLGANVRTTYSSSVNISPGAYGYMTIRVMIINSLTVNIVSVFQLT